MAHMENIKDYDSSYSPIELFEGENAPACSVCCDSGTFYTDAGHKEFCDCAEGLACEENSNDHYDCDGDDEDAFASAGWGMDESYGGYDYDEWN